MTKKKFIGLLAFVLVSALLFTACGDGAGGDPDDPNGNGGNGGGGTSVTFSSLTQNGSANATTTQLTLTFSKVIVGLSASDITLSGASGVTKGSLTGSGPEYTLGISGVSSSGSITVTVSKSGYSISPSSKTVNIFYYSGSSGTFPYNRAFVDANLTGDFSITYRFIVNNNESGYYQLIRTDEGYMYGVGTTKTGGKIDYELGGAVVYRKNGSRYDGYSYNGTTITAGPFDTPTTEVNNIVKNFYNDYIVHYVGETSGLVKGSDEEFLGITCEKYSKTSTYGVITTYLIDKATGVMMKWTMDVDGNVQGRVCHEFNRTGVVLPAP